MKKILACIYSIPFFLLLCSSSLITQSVSEIKFNALDGPLVTDKNLVSVSALISAKQSTADGIHLALIVKNNSGKTILVENTASKLIISLYNEHGFDISVPNIDVRADVNRLDRNWKFRSESVSPSSLHTNGKPEQVNIKNKQYFEIPGGGTSKVSLVIKDVKQVESAKDLNNRNSKPIVKLSPGKYKLEMFLSIISKDKSKSGGLIAGFKSPMIDIDYGR